MDTAIFLHNSGKFGGYVHSRSGYSVINLTYWAIFTHVTVVNGIYKYEIGKLFHI
jgi:hypothetical protein